MSDEMDELEFEARNKFLQKHWAYYVMLEKDFINMEQYVAVDEINFSSFSNEYIKQYQVICSEIDVVAKAYCKELVSTFNKEGVNHYCKCIVDNASDFASRVIKFRGNVVRLTPWKDWSYIEKTTEEGKTIIESTNPKWWKIYNKIKHDRTAIESDTGLPYFKLANQYNVLNALAGLFQLEMYNYKLAYDKYFSTCADMPSPSSSIFDIEDWNNKWVTVGILSLKKGDR